MTFTNEQLTKARSAKSADELLAMAKESCIAMSAEEAAKYFAALHGEGELSDDELASVAGGDKGDPDPERADVNGNPTRRSTEPACKAHMKEGTCGDCWYFEYYPVDFKDHDGICTQGMWS